jgi:hypothetical protein
MCGLYFNFWQPVRDGWRSLENRRIVIERVNTLADATQDQLRELNYVCSICKIGMSSAKIGQCGHYFHGQCLKRLLDAYSIHYSTCPLCRQDLFPDV